VTPSDRNVFEQARRSRDARFDGRFFIGVRTTGIYCRPVCPAPSPKESNVRYFLSAAGAAEAGFRPCLRCRPETSPGTPAWLGASTTVSRALRLIGESALDAGGVDDLADRLGIGARHLRRLFLERLGATPVAVAQTRRVHFAKRLIDETRLPFTEVAMASGFGSLRRFNSAFRNMYGRTPTELRRMNPARAAEQPGYYTLRLRFRPPFDWKGLVAFLAARAIPGVEAVSEDSYRRTIALEGKPGSIDVRLAPKGDALELGVRFPEARALALIAERVRGIFDLGADPNEVAPRLAALAAANPGQRVPGAWDGFELAVRAILGQQVTVKGAGTLAGRLVRAFGTPVEAESGLTHLFPEARILAKADLSGIGLTGSRAASVRALAEAVASGRVNFRAADTAAVTGALRSLPGIGDWTVQYIAMRALGDPDAFPSTDLGLLRASGAASARELERRAEAWRPWRAYAAMHLWAGRTEKG
jgi:AraC family transcriptional regulator of adaptative response / DNA-3-methyladenine glycosylase II